MSASIKPKRRKTSISVYVDVDLSDIEDDDLIAECEARGLSVVQGLPADPWMRAYEALRFKSDPLAEIKQLVMDATGRLL